MSKSAIARGVICLGVLSIAVATLRAGGSDQHGVVSFKANINWAWATQPSTDVRVVDPNPGMRAVIFSNFGKENHLYEDTVAWDVAGPDSGVQQQWVAMPFTPTFDARVSQVSVAAEHNTGSPNSFVLSLNADDGGQIPGKVIRSWIVSNAPKFGTCCTLDTADDIKHVTLSKGTQYWVAVQTNSDEEATRMEWDQSPGDRGKLRPQQRSGMVRVHGVHLSIRCIRKARRLALTADQRHRSLMSDPQPSASCPCDSSPSQGAGNRAKAGNG